MKDLKRIINKAIKQGPPVVVSWVYQEYYVPYYSLMYLLASSIKDGLLVELGVHKGRGLASLAAGNPSNIVLGIDTHRQPDIEFVLKMFPNVWFFNSPSLPPKPELLNRKIDLLHIDTEHSHSMAKAEFEAYQPYLAKGAYILFDDLHAKEDDVKKYFDDLPYFKIQDDRLHPQCGYGVLIYE